MGREHLRCVASCGDAINGFHALETFPGGQFRARILPQAELPFCAVAQPAGWARLTKNSPLRWRGKPLGNAGDLGIRAIRAQADVQQTIPVDVALIDDLDELPQHGLLGVPTIRYQGGNRRSFGHEGEDNFAGIPFPLDPDGRDFQRRSLQRMLGQADIDFQLWPVAQLDHSSRQPVLPRLSLQAAGGIETKYEKRRVKMHVFALLHDAACRRLRQRRAGR